MKEKLAVCLKFDPHDFGPSFSASFEILKDDLCTYREGGQKMATYFYRPLQIKNLTSFCFFFIQQIFKCEKTWLVMIIIYKILKKLKPQNDLLWKTQFSQGSDFGKNERLLLQIVF